MALGKRRTDQDENEIDMTPMLDVVFIMLIFFIVTATFIKLPGPEVNKLDTETEDDYKKDILKWEYFNLERYLWTHRGPRHSRLIQLAFHDCLKYADEDGGGGGCDGCINWSEMGWTPPKLFKDGFKTNEESTKEEPCKYILLFAVIFF